MGWTSTFPLKDDIALSDLQKWSFWAQFYEALHYKARALGAFGWPRDSWVFESGRITGATADHIYTEVLRWEQTGTDSDGDPTYNTVWKPMDYTIGAEVPGNWWLPKSSGYPKNWPYGQFAIVLDVPYQPWSCWKLNGGPDPTHGGLSVPVSQWLNYRSGTVAPFASGIASAVGAGSLTQASANWDADAWKGYVLRFQQSGVDTTQDITGNSSQTVSFNGGGTPDEGTPFQILAKGAFVLSSGGAASTTDHGTATAVSGQTITDTSKTWDTGKWTGASVQYTSTLKIGEMGTATAVASGSISDSSKSWTANRWSGSSLRYTSNGVQISATVTSNTATTLSFSNSNVPTAGTKYYIVNSSAPATDYLTSGVVTSSAGSSFTVNGPAPKAGTAYALAFNSSVASTTSGDWNTWANFWITYSSGGTSKTVRVASSLGSVVYLPNQDLVDLYSTVSFALIRDPSELVGTSYVIQRSYSTHWSDRWLEAPYNKAGGSILGGPIAAWDRGFPIGKAEASGSSKITRFYTPDPAGQWMQIVTRASSSGFIDDAYYTFDDYGNAWPFDIPPDAHLYGPFPTTRDSDVWSAEMTDVTQTNWNRCFSVDFYKTWRGWQIGIMDLCGSFVAPWAMEGRTDDRNNWGNLKNWPYVPLMVPTDLFPPDSFLDVSNGNRPTVRPGSTVFLTINTADRQYTGTYPNSTPGPWQYGRGQAVVTADANGHWDYTLRNWSYGDAGGHNSDHTETLTASLGFTRVWPRLVRNMVPTAQAFFLPWYRQQTNEFGAPDDLGPVTGSSLDTILDVDGYGRPYDPGLTEVGWWASRPADTKYLDGDDFVEGEVAVDLGDTWDHVGWADWTVAATGGLPYAGWATAVDPLRDPPPLRDYAARALRRIKSEDRDKIYDFTVEPDGSHTHHAPLKPRGLDVSGRCAAGGAGWLQATDTIPGWAGPAVTWSWTATDGGSTWLADNTKAAVDDNNPGHQPGRLWDSRKGRFKDFVVEIETSPGYFTQRVIRTFNDRLASTNPCRLIFDPLTECGLVGSSGGGAITCPGRTWDSRFVGKTITLYVGGQQTTSTVLASSGSTLTIADSTLVADVGSVFEVQGLTVANGTRYRIPEPSYRLNPHWGRKLHIVRNGVEVATAKITHVHGDKIWFNTSSVTLPGDQFAIEVVVPGQAWLYRNMGTSQNPDYQWIKPPTDEEDDRPQISIDHAAHNTDSVRAGLIQSAGHGYWPDDQTAIAPTAYSYYGLFENYDYMGAWLFQQAKSAADHLRYAAVSVGFGWTHTKVLGGPMGHSANMTDPSQPPNLRDPNASALKAAQYALDQASESTPGTLEPKMILEMVHQPVYDPVTWQLCDEWDASVYSARSKLAMGCTAPRIPYSSVTIRYLCHYMQYYNGPYPDIPTINQYTYGSATLNEVYPGYFKTPGYVDIGAPASVTPQDWPPPSPSGGSTYRTWTVVLNLPSYMIFDIGTDF